MTKNRLQQWAPLLLRLVIGFGFMAHGWAKLSRGISGFERLLDQAGVPFPHIAAWLGALAELLGGFALLTGSYVTIVAIPLIITMLTAMFAVQIHYGFSAVKTIGLTAAGPVFGPPGYEINLLYIAGLITLMLGGAGPLSVDEVRGHRKRAPKSPQAST